jgi:sec-independent protein translocase protein TatB
MFEVGFTEIVLILGIALLVLGPEKLPKLANQVGRWAGRARSMARQLRQQLDEEVEIIGKDDFGPGVRRPPGMPASGTPKPAAPPATPPPPATPAVPAEPAASAAADREDPPTPS